MHALSSKEKHIAKDINTLGPGVTGDVAVKFLSCILDVKWYQFDGDKANLPHPHPL